MNAPTTSAAERLVATAAVHAGADAPAWRRRVEHLLGAPLNGLTPAPERSALNASGMPLQLCVSFSARATHTRLICDPAFTVADPAARHAASVAAVLAVCADAGLGRAAERVFGHPRLGSGCCAVGSFWLGFGRADNGLALYLNSRLAGGAGELCDWADFLDAVTSPAARAGAADWFDARRHRLVAIGLDLGPAGVQALTLYGRPRAAQCGSLARFAGGAAGVRLLQALGGESAQPLAGITAAVCVNVPDGRVQTAKIDLCRCPRCGPRNAPRSELALLAMDPAVAALRLPSCSALALVGVATQGERPHVNLYLEPGHGDAGRH